MLFLLTKYLVTAGMVVLISEVAKRSDKLGAFIASLPLITLLVLLWLYFEQQPAEKIANHAFYTFWYVLPTLPMFLIFPLAYQKFGFWPALAGGALLTACCFALLGLLLRPFGINLF